MSGRLAGRISRILNSSLQQSLRTVSASSSRSVLYSNGKTTSPGALPWSLGKLNHVAIAVPDLEKASFLYRDVLGASVSEVVPLPDHGVYTVFIDLGNSKIELLHPLGDHSPIESFLKKKPEGGMHHICIEVSDIHEAMRNLQGKVRLLSEEPKIGAHGKPVVFLHPKDCNGVLIELEQE